MNYMTSWKFFYVFVIGSRSTYVYKKNFMCAIHSIWWVCLNESNLWASCDEDRWQFMFCSYSKVSVFIITWERWRHWNRSERKNNAQHDFLERSNWMWIAVYKMYELPDVSVVGILVLANIIFGHSHYALALETNQALKDLTHNTTMYEHVHSR